MKALFSLLFSTILLSLMLFSSCVQPGGPQQILPTPLVKQEPIPTSHVEEDRINVPILAIDTGGHKAMINDIAFTSDGKHLVSSSSDKTVRFWNVSTGKVARVLKGKFMRYLFQMMVNSWQQVDISLKEAVILSKRGKYASLTCRPVK